MREFFSSDWGGGKLVIFVRSFKEMGLFLKFRGLDDRYGCLDG